MKLIPEVEEFEKFVHRPFTTTHFQQWEKRRYKQDRPNSFGVKYDFIYYFNNESGQEFQLGFQYGKPFPLFLLRSIKPDLWEPFERKLSELNWASRISCVHDEQGVEVCYQYASVYAKPNADLGLHEKALGIISKFFNIPNEVILDIISEMKIAISSQAHHLKVVTRFLLRGTDNTFQKINACLKNCECDACQSASQIITRLKNEKGKLERYHILDLSSDPERLSLFQNEVNIVRVIHSKKQCVSLESKLVFDRIRELVDKNELRGIIAWCDVVPEEDIRYEQVNNIAFYTLLKLRDADISNKITTEEALFKRAWLIAEYKRFNSNDVTLAFNVLNNLFGETNNLVSNNPAELLIQYARKVRCMQTEINQLKIQLAAANIDPSKLTESVSTNNTATLTKLVADKQIPNSPNTHFDEDNFAILNALVQSRSERMTSVKHGIFKGKPPRNLRELNETLDSIKQRKLDLTLGLERLEVIARKMGENDPITRQIQQCTQQVKRGKPLLISLIKSFGT